MKQEEFKISIYKSIRSVNEMEIVSLKDVLTTDGYREKINKLRSLEYKSDEFNTMKDSLHVCMINGICEKGKTKSAENVSINPTICIDIDWQDNREFFMKNSIDDLKCLVQRIPSCMYALTSCSGKGLMAIHRLSDSVTKENYKWFFEELRDFYKSELGINCDISCSNVNRLRFVTYDPDYVENKFYEAYELTKDHTKEKKEDFSYDITVTGSHYDLNKCEGPFYFGHSESHEGLPLLNQIITTLLNFYSKAEVKKIFDSPKFYTDKKDPIKARYDAKRWIDWYDKDKIMKPSKKAVDFLNERCGFKLSYSIDNKTNEMISELSKKEYVLEMDDDKYLYDYKEFIVNNLRQGINFLIAPTGQGKTTFWNLLHERDNKSIIVIEPYSSVAQEKFDIEMTQKAVGPGNYINDDNAYIATNYVKFIKYMENIPEKIRKYDFIVVDESHLIGTQSYRSDQMLKFIDAVKRYTEIHKDSYVILQTGTKSNEEAFFDDIKTVIEMKKEKKKFVQIHFTSTQTWKSDYSYDEDKNKVKDSYNNITNALLYYANMYKNEGRKVYIYWGNGSISKMRDYEKCASKLQNMNCAIYHRRNEGNESMSYISENHIIGKYDALMTSCYFSVGCDLNDECPCAVIIVGNNTYQEDEQVIGRLRKSRNIKVNILLDRISGIEKTDVSKKLEKDNEESLYLTETEMFRGTTYMIKGKSEHELKNYIENSFYYYSDLKRKFSYFEEKGYNIVNKLVEYVEDNKKKYELAECIGGEYIPVVTYIDLEEEIQKTRKKRTKAIAYEIEDIYNSLKKDADYDLDWHIENSKDRPKLNEFLLAMKMIQNHYDMKEFLSMISKDKVAKVQKKSIMPAVIFSMKKENIDIIEQQVIQKISEIYEGKDKSLLASAVILGYCYWCKYSENSSSHSYDLHHPEKGYPVFKQWKENLSKLMNIDKEVREYFIGYKKRHSNTELDEISLAFLDDLVNMKEEKKEMKEIFKNKFIGETHYNKFIQEQIRISSYKSKKTKPVMVKGQLYMSVAEAVKATGLSRMQIYRLNKSQ